MALEYSGLSPAGEAAEDISLAEVRGLVRLALWAALIALGGWLSIPLAGVPISMQTFFVGLAGLKEGPRVGFLAAGLYLAAGLLGFPVFAGGLAGPALLFGPTAGFALAFPLAGGLIGLARQNGLAPAWRRGFIFGLLAQALIYGAGVLGLMINAHLALPIALAALLPFVPGDLAKIYAAAVLAARRA